MAGCDAIVIDPDDDVAVALRDLVGGTTVSVRQEGAVRSVVVRESIPLGHKLALRALPAGTEIRKYGESIGIATVDIEPGVHVHVHNLVSRRARRVS